VVWYLVKDRDDFFFTTTGLLVTRYLFKQASAKKLLKHARQSFCNRTASSNTVRLFDRLIQWIAVAVSSGVKRPGREADHSFPSSVEVKNAWRYTSVAQFVVMASCLVKHLYLLLLRIHLIY